MSESSTTTAQPIATGLPTGDTVAKKYVSTADLAAGVDDADFEAAFSDSDPQALLEQANGATKPKKKAAPPPSLDDDGEETESEELEADAVLDPESDDAEEEDDLLPKGKGSKDNPLAVKDLPTDKFVMVKVDGKEEVVDLRDAVNGYIRTQTFDRLTSKVKAAETEALEIARGAVEERQQFRDSVTAWFQDPVKVFERLDEHFPETLQQVGVMVAQRFKHEHENPGAREQRELAKERARLARERQEVEQQRQEHERTQQQREAAARLQEALKPGYTAGIKEAGLLGAKLTPDFRETVSILVERARKAGQLDADVMRQIVVRAAKLSPVETVQQRKPAPAPAPAPKAVKRPASNGKKDWTGVPISQRLKDPAFWGS
jgi:hypothetical protein